MSILQSIQLWHKRARPNPTDRNFDVQLGCHFEEIAEMIAEISPADEDGRRVQALIDASEAVLILSNLLKSGQLAVAVPNRKAFLDSIADQVVTGIGVAHCAGMDGAKACERVNTSNWSKFDENGQPMFNGNGKIMKGPRYVEPNLEGLY